jgi:hypothetical protein
MANDKWAPAVIMLEISREDVAAVVLVQNDHLILTFPPDAPDHPLRARILPRTLRGRENLVNAQMRDALLRPRPMDRIPLPDQILGRGVPRKGLDDLLTSPPGGRVLGHIQMEGPPPIMGEHDQDEEHPRSGRGDREEVHRDDLPELLQGSRGGRMRRTLTWSSRRRLISLDIRDVLG